MDSGGPKNACVRWGVHISATRRKAFLSNYFDHLVFYLSAWDSTGLLTQPVNEGVQNTRAFTASEHG